MNKQLQDRIFDIPNIVLDEITKTMLNLKGKQNSGIKRASKLLADKKVNYGQLKRIIHDLEKLDKFKEPTRYNLYGGDGMLAWGKQFLEGERNLIKSRKKSKKRADVITSLTGIRKSAFLKKHRKSDVFKVPINMMKSNSEKSSITPITSLGLFEEINKIKKIINY